MYKNFLQPYGKSADALLLPAKARAERLQNIILRKGCLPEGRNIPYSINILVYATILLVRLCFVNLKKNLDKAMLQ